MTRYIHFKRSFERIEFETAELSPGGNAFLPTTALVPLLQHAGTPAVPVVSPGDAVREGQLIARGTMADSAHIHAPIPGILKEFRTVPLPDGTTGTAAVINLAGSFDILGRKEEHFPWKSVPESEILRVIEDKGIVNTFGTPVPLVARLKESRKRGNATLALRLFDLDPTCQLDAMLVRHHLAEILEGAAILAKGIDAKNVFLVHEGKEWAGPSPKELEANFPNRKTSLVKGDQKYPSGNARIFSRLIASLAPDVKAASSVYVDAVTALSVYDAVVRNQPTINRYIAVSGPAIDSPAFIRVKVGTPIGDIIEECGGFRVEPSRIVVNGLLSGQAVYDLDTPVTKYTKSLHLMDPDSCPAYTVRECIHCGRCLQVCPVRLDPSHLVHDIRLGKPASDLSAPAAACQSCGCCAIVCPSRIPLHHIIREYVSRNKGENQ